MLYPCFYQFLALGFEADHDAFIVSTFRACTTQQDRTNFRSKPHMCSAICLPIKPYNFDDAYMRDRGWNEIRFRAHEIRQLQRFLSWQRIHPDLTILFYLAICLM